MLSLRPEGLRLLVLIPALALLAMGLAGLVGVQRLGGAGEGAVFLSPAFAILLLLLGAMLLLARYRPSVTAPLGMAVLFVLLCVLAAVWADGLAPGGRTASVLVALIIAACGGVAAICLRSSPPLANIPERHSTLVAVAGVVLAVSASYAIIERESLRANQYAQVTADHAAERIADSVQHFVASIHRMGERWSAFEHVPVAAYLERELEGYLRDFSSMGKISVLDDGGRNVLARQRLHYSTGWTTQPPEMEAFLAWLEVVRQSDEAQLSPFFRQKADGVWVLIAVRVRNAAMEASFIVAQLNITRVLGLALAGDEDIADFQIVSDEHVLYESERRASARLTPIGWLAFDLPHGSTWNMSYYLTAPELGHGGLGADTFPEIYLAACLLFTLAVAASLRFAGIAQLRSRELRTTAITDGLTGLPNRRRLEQLLRDVVDYARRHGTKFAVVSVSMSGVKLVKESLGPAMGDAVLQEVSRRLQQDIPVNASVARFGDHDFIVLLYDTNQANVEACVQRLVDSLLRPYVVRGQKLRLSAHAGYVVSSGDVPDPMQLVRDADLAMLDARQGGQVAWQAYTPGMSALVRERLILLNALQAAIESDALELHYQPVINGHTGRVVAVEALLRWQHAEFGQVAPLRFLPLAEETGVIVPLTDWVLQAACRDSLHLRQKGFPEFPVVVNISPRYFSRHDFVTRVENVLDALPLSPRFLEIEITEGVLLENEDDAILKLRELRELGIGTAIDDFGTGYSSLSYLKNLPVDKVKLDGSFIKDIVTDVPSAAITRGIISMAHHLHLRVVAEQVETEAQYAFLKRSLCDEFQGYLFGRPMACDVLIETLAQNQCRAPLPDVSSHERSDRALLLVDDEKNVLNALVRLFRKEGYRIHTATDPLQALEILAQNEIQVIISDQRMPGMTGTEFFSKVKDLYPDTIRIVLSGYTDLKSVTEAVNHGSIYKFLTKPWDDTDLRHEVARAFNQELN